jgi:hypothetical protein
VKIQQFRVPAKGFWQAGCMGDGYDRMEMARPHKWQAIPSWGRDGWDLGDWPLVVVYHRDRGDGFDLATNVEGDVSTYTFPTRELRDEATDGIAFFYRKWHNESWVEGYTTVEDLPAQLRGAFSWARLDREKAHETR